MPEEGRAGPTEREQWHRETAFREREIVCKERDQDLREQELQLKAKEQTLWKNPVVVAIVGATLAGFASALGSYVTADSQLKLERKKAEYGRILEVINTPDPERVAQNLKFLLDAGLVDDDVIKPKLATYLKDRPTGTGPTSSRSQTTELLSQDSRMKFRRFVTLRGKGALRINVLGGPVAGLKYAFFRADDVLISQATADQSHIGYVLARFLVPENAAYLKWGVQPYRSTAQLSHFTVKVELLDDSDTVVATSDFSGDIPTNSSSGGIIYDGICLNSTCVQQGFRTSGSASSALSASSASSASSRANAPS